MLVRWRSAARLVVYPRVVQLGHGLREIDVYPSIVDQHVVHLEIRTFRVFFVFKLDKCVLQRIARLLVANDFATQDLAKAAKDQFEVLTSCDGVELAHEQHVFGWRNVCERQVSDHFERQRLRSCLSFSSRFLDFFRVRIRIFELFFVAYAQRSELRRCRRRRFWRNVEAFWIRKRVLCIPRLSVMGNVAVEM